MAGYALAVGSGLAIFGAMGLIRTTRRIRIGRFGGPAVATVTKCAKPGGLTMLDHEWTVDYTTASGERCSGVGLPPTSVRAPRKGTRITVFHDPQYPRRAQVVRWEWERIILTGLVGVPGCLLFALSFAMVVVAVFAGAGTRVARWAAVTGRSVEQFAHVAVPVMGIVAAVLLVAGVLITWRRARAAAPEPPVEPSLSPPRPDFDDEDDDDESAWVPPKPGPDARAMLAFAAVLAAISIACLVVGAGLLLVLMFPLLLDGTNWRFLNR